MVAQTRQPTSMLAPSSWLRSGITVESVDGVNLIKLTPDVHQRLEELLEKRKDDRLTAQETAEYAGMAELERMMTFVNAQLIAHRADS
jgi:hypothetical protein